METQARANFRQTVQHSAKGGVYKRFIKRPMDFVLSLLAIIVLSPVMLVIAVLVRVKLGSRVIYKQKRPGLNEKIFTLYKFRTMTDEKDENGLVLPDEMRLSWLGQLLRSTSLDELPELYNILKGDMSFVGPRPLAVEYLPYYSPEERIRHSVRPGLTGLAQVNGRNALQWEERFHYDVQYVKNLSALIDVVTILKTVIKVFRRTEIGVRGVDAPLDFNVYRRHQMKSNMETGAIDDRYCGGYQ